MKVSLALEETEKLPLPDDKPVFSLPKSEETDAPAPEEENGEVFFLKSLGNKSIDSLKSAGLFII